MERVYQAQWGSYVDGVLAPGAGSAVSNRQADYGGALDFNAASDGGSPSAGRVEQLDDLLAALDIGGDGAARGKLAPAKRCDPAWDRSPDAHPASVRKGAVQTPEAGIEGRVGNGGGCGSVGGVVEFSVSGAEVASDGRRLEDSVRDDNSGIVLQLDSSPDSERSPESDDSERRTTFRGAACGLVGTPVRTGASPEVQVADLAAAATPTPLQFSAEDSPAVLVLGTEPDGGTDTPSHTPDFSFRRPARSELKVGQLSGALARTVGATQTTVHSPAGLQLDVSPVKQLNFGKRSTLSDSSNAEARTAWGAVQDGDSLTPRRMIVDYEKGDSLMDDLGFGSDTAQSGEVDNSRDESTSASRFVDLLFDSADELDKHKSPWPSAEAHFSAVSARAAHLRASGVVISGRRQRGSAVRRTGADDDGATPSISPMMSVGGASSGGRRWRRRVASPLTPFSSPAKSPIRCPDTYDRSFGRPASCQGAVVQARIGPSLKLASVTPVAASSRHLNGRTECLLRAINVLQWREDTTNRIDPLGDGADGVVSPGLPPPPRLFPMVRSLGKEQSRDELRGLARCSVRGGCLLSDSGNVMDSMAAIARLVEADRLLPPDNTPVTPTLVVVPRAMLKKVEDLIRACAPTLSVYSHHGSRRLRWSSSFKPGEVGDRDAEGDATPDDRSWGRHGAGAWRRVHSNMMSVAHRDIVLVTYDTLCALEWTPRGSITKSDAYEGWLSSRTDVTRVPARAEKRRRHPSAQMAAEGESAKERYSCLHAFYWHRVVLLGASVINKPDSKRMVAIKKLRARHRWSVFGRALPSRLVVCQGALVFLNKESSDGHDESEALAFSAGEAIRHMRAVTCVVEEQGKCVGS